MCEFCWQYATAEDASRVSMYSYLLICTLWLSLAQEMGLQDLLIDACGHYF
jgi:hypothetical protein